MIRRTSGMSMGRSSQPPPDPSLEQLAARQRQRYASDGDLLRRLCDRDEHALETLYDTYSGLVFTLALRITGDRNLAQEVLQDTFLRCWNGAAQFDRERGHVAAWLMGIARNRAIDVLRSRQHQMQLRQDALSPQTNIAEDAPFSSPGTHLDPSELILIQQTVRNALGNLTEIQRQVIELAYYDGLTQVEIADKLNTPLGTIKTRMRDGLQKLRNALHSLLVVERMRDE